MVDFMTLTSPLRLIQRSIYQKYTLFTYSTYKWISCTAYMLINLKYTLHTLPHVDTLKTETHRDAHTHRFKDRIFKPA